jgi:RNA recognition motif-containing protein
MKIIILDLPRTMTESDLAEMFTPFGSVSSCDLVIDKETGLSKGFGFVVMANEESGNAAITALNRKKIAKQKIRVKVATDKAS